MLWSDPFSLMASQVSRPVGFTPATDVAVGEQDLVLTMDLPGFTAQDLSLDLQNDHLIVRGERRRPEVSEGTRWVHVERPAGSFERRIRIPQGVDAASVTADLVDGVLSLIIPKPERMMAKSIRINTNDQPAISVSTD
jgi:HSP20 family protein